MGAGAKKKHEPNVVAPSAPVSEASIDSGLEFGVATAAGMAAMEDASGAIATWSSVSYPITPAGYGALVGGFGTVKAALVKAETEGAPAQLVKSAWDEIKPITKEFLQALPVAELEELALEKGFPHPGLVGLHPVEGKDHPLVFWLNPYYTAGSPHKQAVYNKALERWETLKNGGTVEGMNLAAYLAAHPLEKDESAEGGTQPEVLTPDELTQLLESKNEALEVCQSLYAKASEPGDAEKYANAKLDYWSRRLRYQAAQCSDPAYEKVVFGYEPHEYKAKLGVHDLPHLFGRLQDQYGLSKLDATLAFSHPNAGDAVTNYLFGTEEQKSALASAIETKKAAIAELAPHVAYIFGALAPMIATQWPDQAKALDLPTHPAETTAALPDNKVVQFLQHLGPAFTAINKVQHDGWHSYHSTSKILEQPVVFDAFWPEGAPEGAAKLANLPSYKVVKKLPAAFRLWAKGQKVQDLRYLAVALGLESAQAKKLTRAQVQNFLAGQFDTKSKAKYEESLIVSPPGVPAPKKTYAYSGPTPVQTGPQKAVAGIMVPADASFAEKRSAMAAGLQHLAAALAVIPDRPSKAEVASLQLNETSAPVSGGIHPKKFFSDGKGRTWMFKTAGNAAGAARAAAEEAASEIFHRIGLPSVPVFRHSLHGHEGSIQPIVAHSGTVNPQPQSWSQADVDAMVRYHLASWVVGDHDGNSENMLRTPGGGIVAIDQGQAWKFIGRDKLNVDYHPNSSFGSQPPVYHRAYKAALSGGLAPGVTIRPEAATPIIDRFEQMSDDDFRQIIEPAAKLGAKSKVPWVGPMTKKAQQRFGTTNPNADQIAEAFVETILERKKNLRKDFAKFFSSLGFAGAHHLEAVA